MLKSFLKIFRNYNVNWSFRKYEKDKNFIKKSFFEDWLQCQVPELLRQNTINASLSFSELSLIRNLSVLNSDSIPYVYKSFLEIPINLKANDTELEDFYRSIIHRIFQKDRLVIENLNEFLPEGEKLRYLDQEFRTNIPKEKTVVLSESQLNAFLSAVNTSQRPKEKCIVFLKKVFLRLRRLRRHR